MANKHHTPLSMEPNMKAWILCGTDLEGVFVGVLQQQGIRSFPRGLGVGLVDEEAHRDEEVRPTFRLPQN